MSLNAFTLFGIVQIFFNSLILIIFTKNENMKKTILICLLSVVTFIAYSQCTPDPSFTSPGIYPDSATNFSAACVGIDYSQTITNIVPLDTVIVVFGMGITTSIDSIVIDNVTGLPPGMSIACNPSGCSYIGGSTGCAIITGICNTIGRVLSKRLK